MDGMKKDDEALLCYIVDLLELEPEPTPSGEIMTSCPWFLDCLALASKTKNRTWDCFTCSHPTEEKPAHLDSLSDLQ
jgi:hypothetical protein